MLTITILKKLQNIPKGASLSWQNVRKHKMKTAYPAGKPVKAVYKPYAVTLLREQSFSDLPAAGTHCTMLNREQTVEECDATWFHSSNLPGTCALLRSVNRRQLQLD